MNLFVSYGHDSFKGITERIVDDLKNNGYNIWFDKTDIVVSKRWDDKIEEGIINSDWIIVIMTQHALRRPNGVCLDELSYARMYDKQIAPIMLENVKPPLVISRLQWLDMQNVINPATLEIKEELYLEKLEILLKVLKGTHTIAFEGLHSDMYSLLKPFEAGFDIIEKLDGFYGREWLYEKYNSWWRDNKKSRLFFIVGEAGCGKSSFAANLAQKHESIVGIHFCKYSDSSRGDAKRIILSLAYYIGTQIPDYMKYISANFNFSELKDYNLDLLYEELFVKPLLSIDGPSKKVAIIIDGLDEIEDKQQSTFLNILNKNCERLPTWFGLILTSRPDSNVLTRLSNIEHIIMETKSEENLIDIKQYLKDNIDKDIENANEFIDKVVTLSEGNILYSKCLLKEINENHLLFNRDYVLPNGLKGFYCQSFDRIFASTQDYSMCAKPLLEVLCSLKAPLHYDDLEEITGIDEYEIETLVSNFKSLVTSNASGVVFFHKSLVDWLVGVDGNPNYRISPKKGNAKIVAWILKNKHKLSCKSYLKEYGMLHMIEGKCFEALADILRKKKNDSLKLFKQIILDHIQMGKQSELAELTMAFVELEFDDADIYHYVLSTLIEYSCVEDALNLAEEISTMKGFEWVLDYCKIKASRFCGNLSFVSEYGIKLLESINENTIWKAEICHLIGDSCRESGHHIEALGYYERCNEMSRSSTLNTIFFNSFCAIVDIEYVFGNLHSAFRNLDSISTNYQLKEGSLDEYRIKRLNGNIHYSVLNIEKAQENFEDSLKIAKKIRNPFRQVEALNSLAELNCGEIRDNLERLIESRSIAESINARLELGKSYYIEGELYLKHGIYSRAKESAEKGLKLLTEVKYGSGVAKSQKILGEIAYQLGDYEGAVAFLNEAHKYYMRENIYPHLRFESYYWLIKAADKLGRDTELLNIDPVYEIDNIGNYGYLKDKIREVIQNEGVS